MTRLIDLTGQRFTRLVVAERAPNDAQGKPRWVCQCDCGNRTTVASADLKKKGRGTKSCGCLAKETASGRLRTHGMSAHAAYAVWRSMLARCLNPAHHAYSNYGGRGIRVCAEWQKSFDQFWTDMGPTYAPGLTLDRKDNDGGYSPDNCRWVDAVTQASNRRDARLVEYQGAQVNVAAAARMAGINSTTLLYRLAAGWPADKLFIKPNVTNREAA